MPSTNIICCLHNDYKNEKDQFKALHSKINNYTELPEEAADLEFIGVNSSAIATLAGAS